MKLEPHPIALCYPPLSEVDFCDLKESIQKNGQLNPITLYEGKVLDGTQRQRACNELGIESKTISPQIDDPVAYVVNQNERRRHLTKLQRTEVAARLVGLKWGTNQYAQKVESSREDSTFPFTKAAKLMGVSEPQVSRFRKVLKSGVPELMQAVKEKRVNLDIASKIAKASPDQQRLELTRPPNVLRAQFSPRNKKEVKVIDPKQDELLAEINAPSIFPKGLPLPVHPTRPDHTKIIQEAILTLQRNEPEIARLQSRKQLNEKIWVYTQCIQTYALKMEDRTTGPIDLSWIRWAQSVADKYRRREEMFLRQERRAGTLSKERQPEPPKRRFVEKGYQGRFKRLSIEYKRLLRKMGFSLADETQLLGDIQKLTKSYFEAFRGPQDRNGSVPASQPSELCAPH
jgi:hypothetical protein